MVQVTFVNVERHEWIHSFHTINVGQDKVKQATSMSKGKNCAESFWSIFCTTMVLFEDDVSLLQLVQQKFGPSQGLKKHENKHHGVTKMV